MNFKIIILSVFIIDLAISWSPYRKTGSFDSSNGCAFIRCRKKEFCVNKKFWCINDEPCPSMLFCAKSQREAINGPSSCDTVRCSKGYTCLLKVRHCDWRKRCRDQSARCVSDDEYYEGPASCAGFKCPSGKTCILRESFCTQPPCRLLKSCSPKRKVHMWMDHCKFLGCLSPHECFMRRPDYNNCLPSFCKHTPDYNNCLPSFCKHSPDCMAKNNDEIIANEKCRGWVCPSNQQCVTKVVGPCQNDDCRVMRFCIHNTIHNNSTKEPQSSETPQDFIPFLDEQSTTFKIPEEEFYSPPNFNPHESSWGEASPRVSLQNKYPEINLENRQLLISFLEKLREDRNSYFKIINQTQRLNSTMNFFDPYLEMILENYTRENIRPTNGENYCADEDPVVESRRNLPPKQFEKKSSLSGEKNTGQVVKFFEDDEIEVVQPDNNNLTYPKIYIKVENNVNPPIKLGSVMMRYHDEDYHGMENEKEKNISLSSRKLISPYEKNISSIELPPVVGEKTLRIKGKENTLIDIQPDYFKRYPKLEVFNVFSGSISLKPNLFQEVKKTLKKLFLTISGNSETLKDAFLSLDSLEYLDIYKSNLEYIKKDTFKNLPASLRDLKLSVCNISFIEEKSFLNLVNLRGLMLEYNNLTKLEPNTFSGLGNVTNLSLQYNRLRVIEKNLFECLSSLKELDISNNNIHEIKSDVFLGTKIATLALHDNNLTKIHSGLFSGLNETLDLLELEHNKIFSIKENCFSEMKKLRWIDLSFNKLVSIEEKSFNGLVTNVLDISSNELFEIQNESFKNTTITKIYLPDDFYENYFFNDSSRKNWGVSMKTEITSKKKEFLFLYD